MHSSKTGCRFLWNGCWCSTVRGSFHAVIHTDGRAILFAIPFHPRKNLSSQKSTAKTAKTPPGHLLHTLYPNWRKKFHSSKTN